MKSQQQKYYLGISKNDRIVFERWITDEQKTIIENYIGHSVTYRFNPLVDHIIETVCEYFKVPVDLIAERTRKIEIVRCRQLCFYFFVNKLHYGTVRAGKIFNLDHATVLHALKKVTTKYKDDMIELNKML